MTRLLHRPMALVCLLAFTVLHLAAQNYIISTLAGGVLPPLPSPALGTSIGGPPGVAVDSSGNVYFVDLPMASVYKLSPAGAVNLVAGTGRFGYSGDGGPATEAQLYAPTGIAVDPTGNIYIADAELNLIRKVTPAGIISTFIPAGQLSNPGGLAADQNGNIYEADSSSNRILKITPVGTITTVAGSGVEGYGGDGGAAVSALLAFPVAVSLDTSGDFYIADLGNSVVREVSAAGLISTVAGNRQGGVSIGNGIPATEVVMAPEGVAANPSGGFYISNSLCLIQFVSASGIIQTVAGGGLDSCGYSGDGGAASAAEISAPTGIAISGSNVIFIDAGNARIRQVSAANIIGTIAGNGNFNESGDGGPAANAQIAPYGNVVLDAAGNLYIADTDNNRIRMVSPSGTITTIAGTGIPGFSADGGPASAAQLSAPYGVAVDSLGDVFIADTYNNRVRKVDAGGTITTIAGTGVSGYSGDGGPATEAELFQPYGVAVDAGGNVFIADALNGCIRKVAADGLISTLVGGLPLYFSRSVTVDSSGNVYFNTETSIEEYSTAGVVSTVVGDGDLGYSGDGGAATSTALYLPDQVAFDASGNMYIADEVNHRIRKVSGGIVTTIAGDGGVGFLPDGVPAVDTELAYPVGVAVSQNGIIFIADSVEIAIRELTLCPQSVPSAVSADATAQTLSVAITAVASCQWSATNLPSWITASSGSGNGSLQFTLQANTTGADRSAAIEVNGFALTVTQDFTTEVFTDVSPSAYYFDAVNLLYAQGITNGCNAAPLEFCPTASITRAQMAIFIVRSIFGGDNFTAPTTPYFSDVGPTDFGFAWIQEMAALGITNGCAVGLYCATASVTRQQMAVFIIRARYGATANFDYLPTPLFTDVPTDAFAFNYIQRMKMDNITSGCTVTMYCPDNVVTRGDMAIFVMRGGYNNLLPAGEPVLTSISPATITQGAAGTYTVTGLNTSFVNGTTTLSPIPGITIGAVTVTSPTTLTVQLTAAGNATPQPVSLQAITGSQEAVRPNGLLIQ